MERHTPLGHGVHQHRSIWIGALAIFVVCFAAFAASRLLPPAPYGLADDWRVFYAAGLVVRAGGNPYSSHLIHIAEQHAEYYQHVQPSLDDFTNPPIVAWLLQMVTYVPFWTSYILLSLVGYLLAAVALWRLLAALGWTVRTAWTLFAMLTWPALLAVDSGQFDLLLFSLVILALWCVRRDRLLIAGLCMFAVVVKPNILWPLPLFICAVLFPHPRELVRFVIGGAIAGVGSTVAGVILLPGSTAHFITHVLSFESRIAQNQPDIASLPGMLGHFPHAQTLDMAIGAFGVLLVIAFSGYWAFSARARALPPFWRLLLGVYVGLSIWLVCTPYAHPNDLVMLFPAMAIILQPDGKLLRDLPLGIAVSVGVWIIFLFLTFPMIAGIVVTIALLCFLFSTQRLGATWLAAFTFVTFVLFPGVWPFHVSPVPLTPLAGLVICISLGAFAKRTLHDPEYAALSTS